MGFSLPFLLAFALSFFAVLDTSYFSASAGTRVVSDELEQPWAVVPAPNSDLYVVEKSGQIKIFKNGQQMAQLKGIPKDLAVIGQGGLMDLAFHPDFSRTNFIYLTYSTKENSLPIGEGNTRVSRFRLLGNELKEEKVLAQGGYGTDGSHFGSRLVFGHDKKLYVTFGERHNKEKAQSLEYLNGKIIRINDDGTIPVDNPFVGRGGVRKEIFSYGHRNPQGIDIQPETGAIFNSEHGPTFYDAKIPGYGDVGNADEVNLILPGANYGWPLIFGHPSRLPWTDEMLRNVNEKGMKLPFREFSDPDGIAPSGIAFYRGDKIPSWKNNLFIACLRGYLFRLKINERQEITEEEVMYDGEFGRIRDVASSPDGYLYFVTDDGQLVQILNK